MITLANIRRAIYNICKRLEILEASSGNNSGGGFSGDYNDLTNKPTIPDAQIQSDWNQSDDTKLDYIKNKPVVTNGSDGKSAYEVAIENGYNGTVQEWLNSLKGQDGTNGTNGTDGTNGISPHIDQTTGNWFIGETNTGVKASFSSESASEGGNTLSLVTTGEKYIWNNKPNLWRGTQVQYDALVANNQIDNNTIYVIIESQS